MEFNQLEPRNGMELLPEQPPSFRIIGLSALRRLAPSARPIPTEIFRGLDWLGMKNQLPPGELIPLQQHVYPNTTPARLESLRQEEVGLLRSFEPLFTSNPLFMGTIEQYYLDLLMRQLRQTPELIRITDWTAALMLAFDTSPIPSLLETFRTTESFGVGRDETDENRITFGAHIYVEESVDMPLQVKHLIPERLAVGEYAFPIFIRYGLFEYDLGAYFHPLNGTAACWAVSRKNSSDIGFLTAAHLLEKPVKGSKIDIQSGIGEVIDIAPGAGHPYGIDAMLVRAADMPPVSMLLYSHYQIDPLPLVAPFTPARFIGSSSGLVKTTITEVTQLFGTLSLHIPARVFLADGGKGGDSGALIQTLTDPGAGAGLYTGRFKDKAGREHGIGMHLAQIADAMSLALYELEPRGN
jgi:hypothetical protein